MCITLPSYVRKETDRHVSQKRSRLSAKAACAHCRRIIRHEKANSKQNRTTDQSVNCLFTVETIMTDEAAEKKFLSYEKMICIAEAIRMGIIRLLLFKKLCRSVKSHKDFITWLETVRISTMHFYFTGLQRFCQSGFFSRILTE